MDYLQIGNLSFERNASKSDMRLDFCSAFQEAALDCGDLAFDTLEAEVFTNTVGPQLSALAANIPVVVYRNNAVYARFVKLTVSRIAPNSYRITGRSPMGALTVMPHTGGIYTGQTAEDIVKEICGNIPVLVETIFSNLRLYGWLPYADGKEKSARDNLAQVLFVIGAYLRTDLNGTLRIEKAWSGTASAIPADRSYSGGTINYGLPVSSVSVAEHQYIAGTDEKELFSGTAQAGDIVTFSEPMHSLTSTGFTILESNANYAKLSAGTGTLKGKTYTHNTRIVTRTVTEGAAENVISIADATLVSLVNSAAVANRLAEYYKHRETISNGVVAGAEKPGHVVSIYHPYDKAMVSACVESLDTTISSTIKSNLVALVGYVPPQPEASEYYDERVVLTGSGTWTPPDGVTSVRVTCIGGGQGGKCGQKGEDGKASRSMSWKTGFDTISWNGYGYTEPSSGGEGGEPGKGGKVYTAELSLESGAAISYTCGAGGEGAAYSEDPAEGSTGTSTTFGTLSSASGASSDSGYYDALGGVTYGAKGVVGLPGGDSGGSTSVQEYPHPDPNVAGYFQLGLGVENAPSVTDEDGNAYSGGAWQVDSSEKVIGYASSGKEYACSPPGGAAAGAAGANGSLTGGGFTTKGATAPNGVNGAAAILTPKKPAAYGQGGRGGYGGGAGSCPGYIGRNSTDAASATLTVGTPGVGGIGGPGGPGADGCIILYYRRPKIVQGGWVKDKNGKLLCERLGRRFIV